MKSPNLFSYCKYNYVTDEHYGYNKNAFAFVPINPPCLLNDIQCFIYANHYCYCIGEQIDLTLIITNSSSYDLFDLCIHSCLPEFLQLTNPYICINSCTYFVNPWNNEIIIDQLPAHQSTIITFEAYATTNLTTNTICFHIPLTYTYINKQNQSIQETLISNTLELAFHSCCVLFTATSRAKTNGIYQTCFQIANESGCSLRNLCLTLPQNSCPYNKVVCISHNNRTLPIKIMHHQVYLPNLSRYDSYTISYTYTNKKSTTLDSCNAFLSYLSDYEHKCIALPSS